MLGRIGIFFLTDRRALALITVIYLLAGVVFLHYDYALNNEGLTVHYWATWAALDLPAVFFLQKAKPVLTVLYALPSQLGVLGTLVAHLVVSALAVPLIGGFARSLDYRLPNFPAIVVAFSPIFFLGGAAGIANNDAVVGTILVLFLLVRGWSLSAGLILGCLPWVRSELAPLVPILWLHAIFIEPNRRFALGTVVFPIAYLLAGAFYHHDLLWAVHYPPSSPFNPDNPMWQGFGLGPRFFLAFLAAVTPIAGLVVCLRFGRLRPLERTLLFYTIVMLVLLETLPMFKLGNFGGSPRYLLQVLPTLALFAARALEPVWEGGRLPVWGAVIGVACMTWSVTRLPGMVHAGPFLFALVAVFALGLLRLGRMTTLAAALFVLAGPVLVPGTQIPRDEVASYLDPMEAWLRAHPEVINGPIYTNSQLLDAIAQLHGRLGNADVRFLMGFDHVEGSLDLSNPNNGQRDAVRRLCRESLYGRGVVASTLRPDDLPPGTLFALRVEKRLNITLPPSIWKDRLEILFEQGNVRIARLRPPPSEDPVG